MSTICFNLCFWTETHFARTFMQEEQKGTNTTFEKRISKFQVMTDKIASKIDLTFRFVNRIFHPWHYEIKKPWTGNWVNTQGARERERERDRSNGPACSSCMIVPRNRKNGPTWREGRGKFFFNTNTGNPIIDLWIKRSYWCCFMHTQWLRMTIPMMQRIFFIDMLHIIFSLPLPLPFPLPCTSTYSIYNYPLHSSPCLFPHGKDY